MNFICSIICLICCGIVIYLTKRLIGILKNLDEEQQRKLWEADLYEDKKDNN